jgi:Cof subfamily protein (haloacid dehalogenase superfamily)
MSPPGTQSSLPSDASPQTDAGPFDLVVLDLDGTILDLYRHAPISDAVASAIAAVQAAGIPVTIATGRTLDYVREHIIQLGITTPVVTTQGAVIGDPVTGQILDETTIPLPLARQAAAWIDAHPYITALYFNDDEGHIHIYQNRSGEDTAFLDHVFGFPRSLQPTFAPMLVAEAARSPLKFIVVEDRDRYGVDLVTELKTRFSPGLTITRTHPLLVEGTAQGIDKGLGVRHLCELLNIDPQRVLAIGDSDNDIPMLETVGFGVAMGNSSAGVLAVAQYIAPPVEADGVAVVLEELVLKRGDSHHDA